MKSTGAKVETPPAAVRLGGIEFWELEGSRWEKSDSESSYLAWYLTLRNGYALTFQLDAATREERARLKGIVTTLAFPEITSSALPGLGNTPRQVSPDMTARTRLDRLPERILFIGNSCTERIRDRLSRMLADSPFQEATFEFLTRDGATLQQHLADPATVDRILTGNWDVVVLQEQSQIPAFPGYRGKSFQTAVDAFVALVRNAGAEPVLYTTWGRRDGDPGNPRLFPDYETMQKRLSEAYRTAALRNRVSLLPVGQAWSAVKQRDRSLWSDLYETDGSHPSAKGAYLASSVILRCLLNDPLESVEAPDALNRQEREIIQNTVLQVCMNEDTPM